MNQHQVLQVTSRWAQIQSTLRKWLLRNFLIWWRTLQILRRRKSTWWMKQLMGLISSSAINNRAMKCLRDPRMRLIRSLSSNFPSYIRLQANLDWRSSVNPWRLAANKVTVASSTSDNFHTDFHSRRHKSWSTSRLHRSHHNRTRMRSNSSSQRHPWHSLWLVRRRSREHNRFRRRVSHELPVDPSWLVLSTDI